MVQYISSLHEASKKPRYILISGAISKEDKSKYEVRMTLHETAQIAAHRNAYPGSAGSPIVLVMGDTLGFGELVSLVEKKAKEHGVEHVALAGPNIIGTFKQAGLF
jgi:hypothetical protein